MSLGIDEILRPALGDRSTRFVFPSEICAEAWLARALRMPGGPRALEAERFLGWDRMKEEAAEAKGRTPVDDCLRRIFAARLLADNEEAPFLSSIVAPAYAAEWQPFASYLASRLPALGILPGLLRSTGGSPEESPAAADWLGVRARYEEFLGAIGRFEPSFEPRALRELPGNTVIFFPELIEDFEEYRAALEGAPSVRIVGLPRTDAKALLRRPKTALAELRETLAEAGELLDGGLGSDDIAITVAGLDGYRPYLEREAALLSVPIALRSGAKLVATPGGRLFAALRDVYASGFSYDALRNLLLSPAWPWKAPEIGRGIMAEGMRLHAIAPWPEGNRQADAWERSLSGQLKAEYRKLKARITAIAAAPDFRSLMKAYNAFKSEFLSRESEDWETGANLSLARCVVKLEELVSAEGESGLEVPKVFSLFMRVLESETYVSAGGAGLPVYEWRVAAGIFPERHFILGASQDSLAVPSRGFDFLGERLRRLLGAALYHDPNAADRDSGPDFIRAYAQSGAAVSFSCPEAGFAGELAAHGFLVSMSTEDASARRVDSAYRDEAAWLSGRGSAPLRLHAAQSAGLAAAAAAMPAAAAKGKGGGAHPLLDPPTARLAFSRLEREDGRPSIDSTAIDYYLACPYAYLYLRLLRARPEASGITFVDALFIGDVYHAALAFLFKRIAEGGRFRRESVEAYRGLIEDCLDEAFGELARSRGPFVAVVLEVYRGRLKGYLSILLDAEAERFAGLEIASVEEELELEYPDLAGGVVLRGRIDRISRSEKGSVIVDYKKAKIPDKRSVAPDEAGAIAEAQMPCYLRLVSARAGGAAIDSAWYLSIEGHDGKPPAMGACAFGDDEGAYVPRSALAPFLRSFDAALRSTAEGIAAGEFPLASKEAQRSACQGCGARGICRDRYALRFGASAAGGGRA